MKRSKSSGKQRAFQGLPRFLRRRAASHNVKRVPHRIRARAAVEMATDNTPDSRKKSKRGYSRKLDMIVERSLQENDLKAAEDTTGINSLADVSKRTNVKFLKRQIDKIWLPTHLWQAKRTHMVNKWGYSIADTPNQKCYRATHRMFSSPSAIAWDTSYYADIVLDGSSQQLQTIISTIFGTGACSPVVVAGKKCWEGLLTIDGELLGPAIVYWASNDIDNKVLIHVHPEMFTKFYNHLCSFQKDISFDIHDCRTSLGSIDIKGARSLFALWSILHERVPSFSDQLGGVANINYLPSNIAFTFEVEDPRFYSPHHVGRPSPPATEEINFDGDRNTALLTIDGRQKSYVNQSTIKDLGKRHANTAPGKPIEFDQANDPLIPVIVFKKNDNSLTMMVPWNWVLPFWYILQQVDQVTVGGLKQMHQLSFEHGHAFFPVDYPFTNAGKNWAESSAEERLAKWNRTPVAKRVNYSKINIGYQVGEHGKWYTCDWDLLENQPDDYHLARINYKGRGSPSENARVYKVPLDGATVSSEDLIGFVTSGEYNLKNGKGSAIASIKGIANQVMVRNAGESIYRLAYCAYI